MEAIREKKEDSHEKMKATMKAGMEKLKAGQEE
jgi:hypothetical protein